MPCQGTHNKGVDFYGVTEGAHVPFYYLKSVDSNSSSGGGDTPVAGNSLQSGDKLSPNEYLASSNGRYRLYLQDDGNIVLRDWSNRAALWAANTQGKGGTRLVLQSDGNLVLYTASSQAVWASNTQKSGADRVTLNDDGSLAIYAGSNVLWAVNGDGSAGANTGGSMGSTTALPSYDHVVVVVEENHSSSNIIGNSAAPYINSLAKYGVLFNQSYAIEHPSQPNYLDLFSGSNQGVTSDRCPVGPFNKTNLASQLLAVGMTFTGYAEDLPVEGSTVCSKNGYVRKHAPWVDFSNVPSWMNKPMSAFPSDYNELPTVSWVIPNLNHDMHDGTVADADTWLKNRLDGYAQWAKTHNSLLIVTFDEDDNSANNRIATIVYGAHLKTGTYSERIDHYSVLRLLEDFYGLPHAGQAASAHMIRDIFSTSN